MLGKLALLKDFPFNHRKAILHERNFDANEWDNEPDEGKALDPELEQSLHDEEEDPTDPNPSVLRYRKIDYSMDAW